MTEPTMKFCLGCDRFLLINEWGPSKGRPDGLQSRCIECMRAVNRRNREQYKQRDESEVPYPERKRCAFCYAVKDNVDFNRNRSVKDGLQSYCRPCAVIANQLRRKGLR